MFDNKYKKLLKNIENAKKEKSEIVLENGITLDFNQYEIVQKYKKLQSTLQDFYGECGDLLEKLVENIVSEEKSKFSNHVHRSQLLLNEDVEKWEIYKKAEEEDKLRILPCSVGDTVYAAYKGHEDVEEYKVDEESFIIHLLSINAWGNTFFPTKEQALEKLKSY